MVFPAPRSAHNQTLDEHNKCGAADPYSKTGSSTGLGDGEYCGVGCLGEACLYYQIGCYAGCPTCSLTGKDLYPTSADLRLADHCEPIEPTLGGGDPAHERELRTHNVDGLSKHGDWTKVNPWRAPGTAGSGNPDFQPCGINSGSKVAFPNPPTTAKDVPKAGPGTALPPVGKGPVWKRGATVEAAWALYANHAGGYSYRLCKQGADGAPVTEACFQQTPLDFVGAQTEIRYTDANKPSVKIPAVTTAVGTHPEGSQWRKNPVPMCNCDLGYDCFRKEEKLAATVEDPRSSEPQAGAGKDGYEMFNAYNKTNFHPGQSSTICPTGVQFATAVDDVLGATPYMPGGKMAGSAFEYMMVDRLKVPQHLEPGDYVLSWRWDCEETPQVWNSCADLTIA
jgi:hypothetical protein